MTNVTPSTSVEIPADLRALRLPELQRIASSLGITGLSKLRKGDLIAAIEDRLPAGGAAAESAPAAPVRAESPAAAVDPETPSAVSGVAQPTTPTRQDAGSQSTDGVDASATQAAPSRARRSRRASTSGTVTAEPTSAAVHTNAGHTGTEDLLAGLDQVRADKDAQENGRRRGGRGAGRASAPAADPTAEQRPTEGTPEQAPAETSADRTQAAAEQTGTEQTGTEQTGTERADIEQTGTDRSADQGRQGGNDDQSDGQDDNGSRRGRRSRGRGRGRGQNADQQGADQPSTDQRATDQQGTDQQGSARQDAAQQDGTQQDGTPDADQQDQKSGRNGQQKRNQDQNGQNGRNGQQKQNQDQNGRNGQQKQGQGQEQAQQQDADQQRQGRQPQSDRAQQEEQEGNRSRRQRDRKRGRGGANDDFEPEITEDDVLIPIAGILDVLDNYAFVRTTGYLPGPNDVYVSLGQVKKYHLRKGDAVVGAIKQPRNDEQSARQKYNALVKVDTINGQPVDDAATRTDFHDLTPLYPNERLRLETEPAALSTRIIDLVAPIGKGQRGMIVSPPKAGKTVVLQAVANAISKNNPEVHLMVVLVDERPEEVTDMQRTVKGEVIASTFDRPAEDHTTVAELAIERAKRLVELGHDVVVLLDSLTRLGRAYNQVTPPSGRVLAGGVDAAALYPAKRFFGAARNVENGGSLTILATALVETGSATDQAILDEFTGTANMELRLDGGLADRRVFPAVDVRASGTRREESLLSDDEVTITSRLRRALAGLDTHDALETVLRNLRDTQSNVEFLVQVQKSVPSTGDQG